MAMKILIFGAGAIGRGYLGPLLQKLGAELSFVDNNKTLVELLKKRRTYKAAITKTDGYEIVEVPVNDCFHLDEVPNTGLYDIVCSCVGPNNCYDLAEYFKEAKTVISCENDSSTSVKLRELSGNPNIFFGIPDVITSNTASPELLEQDPLMTVTEQGVLVLEKGNYQLPDEIYQFDQKELNMHWMCKLFIHNAPHAIVAYLGWLKGYRYIHESMNDPEIREVVIGSINEITDGLIVAGYTTKEFAEAYKQKEISRFRNDLLFDTISRVAREPIRKLRRDNRLVLGMRIVLYNCKLPIYTAIGAKAALAYNDPKDTEAEYLQNLKKNLGEEEILRNYCGIELFDPLNRLIVESDIKKFIKRET
mgnify:CR=1 FL=1|jgi:mannitol-1-phosphate 5-dehydrogenase